MRHDSEGSRSQNGPAEGESTLSQRAQERQEQEVEERTAISVHVVYEAIRAEGEAELKRPTWALAFSGLAAGLSMGFSFLTQGLIEARLPQAKWAPLVGGLGYSMGFLIVILGRQQLFTENTLTPIIPLLKDKRPATLWNTSRLWAAVFLANWVGTLAFAWAMARSGIIAESAKPTFIRLGQVAMAGSFGLVVVKAIFAGWLIALLVWLLPFAETGRVAVIVMMTYLIALGSFHHVIAGSVDTFYLVALGVRSWSEYLGGFLLPTLLGNIIGGVSLVAVLNHAQVTAGAGG